LEKRFVCHGAPNFVAVFWRTTVVPLERWANPAIVGVSVARKDIGLNRKIHRCDKVLSRRLVMVHGGHCAVPAHLPNPNRLHGRRVGC
jgi:hypothetical protein